ncbi:hypothetical protein ACJ41O_011555 [Fusarium nematophilum]
MVHLSSSTLAILASASVVAGMPSTSPAGSLSLASNHDAQQPFSFESWVESIIANPDGDHLSPEEAVKAAEASRTGGEGSLDERAWCWGDDNVTKAAYVPDAVKCINRLAAKGKKRCRVDGTGLLCKIGRARIRAQTGGTTKTKQSDTCNNIARSAGKVMDKCTRADNTVHGSEYAWGNKYMVVNVQR